MYTVVGKCLLGACDLTECEYDGRRERGIVQHIEWPTSKETRTPTSSDPIDLMNIGSALRFVSGLIDRNHRTGTDRRMLKTTRRGGEIEQIFSQPVGGKEANRLW